MTNYGETSVAQFTFGLIIALVRRFFDASTVMKKFADIPPSFLGRDLSKLSLGIVGTGAIGAAVCKLGKCFGMKLYGYDLNQKQELVDKLGLEYLSLDELVKSADIISLHLPYNADNYHMFNEEIFNQFKDNSYFINTSRGELVDLAALYKHVEAGKIRGVALDVLACERVSFQCTNLADKLYGALLDCLSEALYVEKLSKHENVIITPHIAYETQDSIDYILEKTMENIRKTINGDKMCRIV